jgi:hypothetical protein
MIMLTIMAVIVTAAIMAMTVAAAMITAAVMAIVAVAVINNKTARQPLAVFISL